MFNSLTFSHIVFLIILGVTPSIIWLLYYLKKDDHPEPKKMIAKVFCYGFVSVFFAFALEWAFIIGMTRFGVICDTCANTIFRPIDSANVSFFTVLTSTFILSGLAFIEEFVKYIAAKIPIIRSKYFDEPVDAMIYLIVAALGFAAAENIGYIFQNIENAFDVAYFRFLSATFLHALASAIVGYFFALSILYKQHKFLYRGIGLLAATLLHALFNSFIISLQDNDISALFFIFILIITTFFVVAFLFDRLKRITLWADQRMPKSINT